MPPKAPSRLRVRRPRWWLGRPSMSYCANRTAVRLIMLPAGGVPAAGALPPGRELQSELGASLEGAVLQRPRQACAKRAGRRLLLGGLQPLSAAGGTEGGGGWLLS